LPWGCITPRQSRVTFPLATVEEINLVGYDAGFAAQLEKTLQKDLRHAKKLICEAWNLRSLIDKILELISIPIKEQLLAAPRLSTGNLLGSVVGVATAAGLVSRRTSPAAIRPSSRTFRLFHRPRPHSASSTINNPSRI
jgi:hypothetical protein